MKKLIAVLCMVALICTLSVGCGGSSPTKKDTGGAGTGTGK